MPEKEHRYSAQFANEMEPKWHARWAEAKTFEVPNPGEPGFDDSKESFYCLDMFPYPSGAGLHVGHPEGYTATDIISRYKRMKGFNVLHPMGWDAFGLPAEQYAIRTGVHPAKTTRASIDNFRRQLQRFGFCYDWSREFGTIDEGYYRWTQWIFVQIYDAWFDPAANKARPIRELEEAFACGQRPPRINPEAAEFSTEDKALRYDAWGALDRTTQHRILSSYRLAYLGEQTVNWCPQLGTALANEEVIDGRSERGGHPVLRKPLRQWLFRISAYGDRLIEDLASLDWPESTRVKQIDWIGRSRGAEADFVVQDVPGVERLRIYTTRPDTMFGATFMVVAPEHPFVDALPERSKEVDAYVEQARNRSDLERQTSKEKTGVASGYYAINPATGKRIPIWIADYVLMGYGHGAIMAVPAHDDRDYAFADKYGIDIVEVLKPTESHDPGDGCFTGDGIAINSANAEVSLDGLATAEAKERITAWLTKKCLGNAKVNYRLRDWLFSRQRYWGEPFPIVYDRDGLHEAVAEDELPVTLPPLSDYAPEVSDEPKPLLAKAADWVQLADGRTRETNTMPGWAGSCWYYLRYCDPHNDERFVGRKAEAYWLGESGVDLYVGGAEHAVLHLLYARFWHKVLFDLGHVQSPEPFRKLFHQGMITSYAFQRKDRSLVPIDEVEERGEDQFVETATGEAVARITAKMSKSLKNVINPDDVIRDYGADTFRLYEMYMGPLEASKPWNTRDIAGLFRFLTRSWRLLIDEATGEARVVEKADPEVEKLLHRTIAKVGDDIDRMAFNTAIAAMIEFVNLATSKPGLTREQAMRFVAILAPFAPHIAEEVWSRLGAEGFVSDASWPSYDESMLKDDEIEIPIQIMGKVRHRITVAADLSKSDLEKAALGDAKVQELITGKTVRKVIVVPGRLVNIVAS